MKERLEKLFRSKTAKILLLCALALVLLIAVWKVFFPSGEASAEYGATEQEARLAAVLSKIEGVKSVSVMIGNTKEGIPASAIVVFDGEDGLLTRMRILEAAAGALNVERENVLVYPANSSRK